MKRQKGAQELAQEAYDVSMNIIHHLVNAPSVKIEGIQAITMDMIKHIIAPQTEEDIQEYTTALRKKKILDKIRKNIGVDEILFVIGQRLFLDQYSTAMIYGHGHKSDHLLYKELNIPESKKRATLLRETDTGYEKIQIPDLVSKRLVNYLKNMNLHEDDCSAFACYMMGVTQLEKLKNKERSTATAWNMYEKAIFKEPTLDLRIGDNIQLSAGEEFKHYAIYLGNNFFISKLGQGGAIVFNSLEELKKVYEADQFVIHRWRYDVSNFNDVHANTLEESLAKAQHYKKLIDSLE